MTTREARRKSLAERFEEDNPLDAAAAKAAVSAVALINDAFADGPFESQSALAEALHITEGRVSQLLNGDGNMRVSTLARFLKANGLELVLQGRASEDAQPPHKHRTIKAS